MRNNKIIVAGYVSLDITPAFPDSFRGSRVSDVLRPGKLLEVGKVSTSIGGAVTNTGLALKKLGADVSLCAKIADDSFGQIVMREYEKHHADVQFIRSDTHGTSYTVVIAVPGNDRIFLVNPGANDVFMDSDLDWNMISEAQYFHFGYPQLMRSFYEDKGEMLARMYRTIKEHGLVTSLDSALPDPSSDAGKTNWEEILSKALPYVDFFVPSIEELGLMLDRKAYDKWQEKAAQSGRDICMELSLEEDIRPLADRALSLGCASVLLKCGAAGIYYRSSSEERMMSLSDHFEGKGWGNIDFFQNSYRPDRILSGTGAGDTAIAGFLYGVSHGYDPQTCVKIAAGCGSMCITEYDTLSGLIPIEKVLERIDRGWEEQFFLNS